jgi:hypothetical protein
MKTLSQDSRSPGRDSNPRPPEYVAGLLTTRPRRSVRNEIRLLSCQNRNRGKFSYGLKCKINITSIQVVDSLLTLIFTYVGL